MLRRNALRYPELLNRSFRPFKVGIVPAAREQPPSGKTFKLYAVAPSVLRSTFVSFVYFVVQSLFGIRLRLVALA